MQKDVHLHSIRGTLVSYISCITFGDGGVVCVASTLTENILT